MKRSILSILVIGLVAALLASCGQSTPGQQTAPTAAPTQHATVTSLKGRIAWQGQLWPGQDLHWEIERDAPDGRRQDGGGAEDGGAAWQSRLRLRRRTAWTPTSNK